MRGVVADQLESLGFDMLIARDGHEGVELFRQHADEIVLVLLDLKMPEMGGEDALTAIRGIKSSARVILTSGYTEGHATQQFGEHGLVGFLQKPYEMAMLQRKLREVLGD